MENYRVDASKKWDYENGFYLTCETGRIGKILNHLEVYKKILNLPGDILEFGVYKGTSLVRLLSFRELLENGSSRKVVGFGAFGKFPDDLDLDSDREFANKFDNIGGYGISRSELEAHLGAKRMANFQLIEGDLRVTIGGYLEKNPSLKIALLHIDVDIYEPTKVILEQLWDRIVPGGILMLDDYALIEGETRAVDEFFSGMDIEIFKPQHYHSPSYIIKS